MTCMEELAVYTRLHSLTKKAVTKEIAALKKTISQEEAMITSNTNAITILEDLKTSLEKDLDLLTTIEES